MIEKSKDKKEKKVKNEVDELKEKLKIAQQEAKSNYNKYLYLLAEFENFKKRNAKERANLLKYGYENLLHEILPLLDNLRRAVEHSEDSNHLPSLIEGLKISMNDFERNLKKFGVEEIKCVGEDFNPAIHEAISIKEEKGTAPNKIIAELRKGYFFHERVLCPAEVVVSAASKEEKKEDKK